MLSPVDLGLGDITPQSVLLTDSSQNDAANTGLRLLSFVRVDRSPALLVGHTHKSWRERECALVRGERRTQAGEERECPGRRPPLPRETALRYEDHMHQESQQGMKGHAEVT